MNDAGIFSHEETTGTRACVGQCSPCPQQDLGWPAATMGAVGLLCGAYILGALFRAMR